MTHSRTGTAETQKIGLGIYHVNYQFDPL